MAIKLVDAALPKTTSGRKGSEIDAELVAAIAGAFKTSRTTEVAENGKNVIRPRALGPDTPYDTRGKASSAGRRYADAVAEAVGEDTSVKVNVYSSEKDKPPFYFRLYISLASEAEAATAPAA